MERQRRLGPALGVAVVLGVVAMACSDVSTSPTTPVALAFDTLPAPSVVYGDTLRDFNGVAAKLTGHAYNADGDEIVGANINYIMDDSSGTIDPTTEYLIATTDRSQKKLQIFAEINGIPSQTARTLQIVEKPDSVDRGENTPPTRVDTLNYRSTDSVATLAANLQVRVLHTARPDSTVPVGSWPVRFRVLKPAGSDTLLVNDNGGRSSLDTTSEQGFASRKIRIRRHPDLSSGVPDTVIVEAEVRNKDGLLRGAPVRFTVITRKTN